MADAIDKLHGSDCEALAVSVGHVDLGEVIEDSERELNSAVGPATTTTLSATNIDPLHDVPSSVGHADEHSSPTRKEKEEGQMSSVIYREFPAESRAVVPHDDRTRESGLAVTIDLLYAVEPVTVPKVGNVDAVDQPNRGSCEAFRADTTTLNDASVEPDSFPIPHSTTVNNDQASENADAKDATGGPIVDQASPEGVTGRQSNPSDDSPSTASYDATSPGSAVGPSEPLVDETQPSPSTSSLRYREDQVLGGKEILFERPPPHTYAGWDNLQWLSFSGERKIRHLHQPIYRLFDSTASTSKYASSPSMEGTGGFWSKLTSTITSSTSTAGVYEPRALAVYEQPLVILVLKSPTNMHQVNSILGLPNVDNFLTEEDSQVDHYWIVESVVDPSFCKLRLSNLTTVTSVVPPNGTSKGGKRDEEDRRKTCFELITPHESILLSAVRVREDASKYDKRQVRSYFSDSCAFLEASAVETALVQALRAAHELGLSSNTSKSETGSLSWKHQCILGTLHSIVVSSDVKALELAVEQAKLKVSLGDALASADASTTDDDKRRSLQRIIDEEDDEGLTPLYFACLRRSSHAVTLLVAAGARVDFIPSCDPLSASLAHVCARNLDSKSLSVLLSSSQTSIANAVDALGRTPMYVAATEGTTASGYSDSVALSHCLLSLETWGGTFVQCSAVSLSHLMHPVAVLAGRWSPDELSVVLERVPWRYPFQGNNGRAKSIQVVDNGMSVSAMYQYPIHRAIISLSNYNARSHEGGIPNEDKQNVEHRLIRTVRLLLEHSFEPNERLEAGENDPFWSDEYVGHTPLQMLASIALSNVDGAAAIRDRQTKLIHETAEFLVRNGARLSIDSPPLMRLRSNNGKGSSNSLKGSSDHSSRRSKLKIDSKEVMAVLGGEECLKLAQKEWSELKSVDVTTHGVLETDEFTPKGDEGVSLSDTDVPGGNSERSCAICWKEFGSVMNRKHRCRVTHRYLCDACSSKRIVSTNVIGTKKAATEYRLSDGQFLLARIDAAKDQSERAQARAREDEARARDAEQARAQARLERLEAETASNRDSLFGGMVEQATTFVFGNDDSGPRTAVGNQQSASVARQAGDLSATLNETRNAMLERGQKIQDLGDKSAKLVVASSDFARMAKELRRKTESQGLFW